MYTRFFKLTQAPFSIAPDPRYLLLTHGHREALGHLLYGVNSGGGVVLLTGEIGAGKTTVCRCFLEQVPSHCNVAYIFNPKLTVDELLQAICEEFGIAHEGANSVKDYVDVLTAHLLETHAQGRNTILIIDEAQNLSADVLEQLRLLTNLETNERKLLQIILIGQPELRSMLARPELKQLAQRVIARYHLGALSKTEIVDYIAHRLSVAGLAHEHLFSRRLAKRIHRLTHGVPRRINLLCDRAMLGAYAEGRHHIDRAIIDKAAAEVFGTKTGGKRWPWIVATGLLIGAAVGAAVPLTLKKPPRHLPPPIAKPIAPSPEPDGITRATLKNESDAYRLLSATWGEAIAGDAFCETLAERGLHCLQSDKGLTELTRLDRPAVLVMQDEGQQPAYLVLTGLNDTTATLRTNTEYLSVNLSDLRKRFKGNFVALWREPRAYRTSLKLGDKGPDVDWVAAQLAQINGEAPPEPGQAFDEKLAQQLRAFQTARGLEADGLVGPLTLMHLNQAAEMSEPHLRMEPVE